MRLRMNQVASILCDEMSVLSHKGVDADAGEIPRWDHMVLPGGSIQSLTNEWRDWLSEFQEWGQPRGKRDWLHESRMEV